MANASASEEWFRAELIRLGVPEHDIITQYRFAKPVRNWEADFFIPSINCIIEIEGVGGFNGRSRHREIGGFTADLTKYSVASALGYTLLRATTARGHMRFVAGLVLKLYQGEPLTPENLAPLTARQEAKAGLL